MVDYRKKSFSQIVKLKGNVKEDVDVKEGSVSF